MNFTSFPFNIKTYVVDSLYEMNLNQKYKIIAFKHFICKTITSSADIYNNRVQNVIPFYSQFNFILKC